MQTFEPPHELSAPVTMRGAPPCRFDRLDGSKLTATARNYEPDPKEPTLLCHFGSIRAHRWPLSRVPDATSQLSPGDVIALTQELLAGAV